MTTTTAPSTSTYDPHLDLSLVRSHAKNPRRRAEADDELVASVRANGLVQPIIVAPDPDDVGHFVLLAGHRRRDACIKAGLAGAPAVIRTDLLTGAQQLAAMLVENGRRVDLTPIEEAEAYQELTLFGWKQKDIAREVGRSASTISARMKLLHLNERTRSNVHDGQITLDDALAMVDHTGTDRATLEQAAGTSTFRYELEAANRRKAGRIAFDTEVQALTAADVPPYAEDPTAPLDTWALQRAGDITRLYGGLWKSTTEHPTCLSWCREDRSDGVPIVVLVCTDPDSHRGAAPAGERGEETVYLPGDREAQVERERLAEERRQQWRAEQEAAEISATLRRTIILEQIKPGLKLDKAFAAALRALLPTAAMFSDGFDLEGFYGALGIEDENVPGWNDTDTEKGAAVLAAVDAASDYQVVSAVVAFLIGGVDFVTQEPADRPMHAARYFDHLIGLEHHLTEHEERAYAAARGDQGDDETHEEES